MLKSHVLRNDTNCFRIICKGRHRNASFLSVPLTDAISTEKRSKGKHWRQRKYDIETQEGYNLSGAYQLVFSLESYLQHKCSTTFSCFQLLTIKIGVSPTSLTLHMYLETDVRFWVSIHWKGNVLMSSATMTSFPKAVASLRRKEHQRKQTTKIVHSQCSSDNRSDEDFLLAEIAI